MPQTTQTRKQGSLDFVQMIYNGHPEYSLLAVKAPIEAVIESWIEFRESQSSHQRHDWRSMQMKMDKLKSRTITWKRQISIVTEESEEEGEIENIMHIPVIQVMDTDWVVIIRSLSWLDSEQIDNIPKEASFLSQKLQTQVITLMEEDTSGSVGYSLLDNGEVIESLEFCDAEEYTFQSQHREDPQFVEQEEEEEEFDEDESYDVGKRQEMQFIDRTFAALGIYLPAVWYSTSQGLPAIQVMPVSENTIERADWITIEEVWEIETKTIDEDDAE
jgi:hypothetical protein